MIQVNRISFSYDDQPFMVDLSFEIHTKEIVALIGHNGVGKTTILNLIYNLISPHEGKILLFGKAMNALNETSIKKSIGYMPQTDSLFENLTVIENLHLVSHLYQLPEEQIYDRVRRLVQVLQIEDMAGKLYKDLSGGQKRLACFAATIIHKPKLLLLDEPFESLDMMNMYKVTSIIKSLTEQGSTTLISSHIVEPLEGFCDKYLIMDCGKIKKEIMKEAIGNNVNFYEFMKNEQGIEQFSVEQGW